MAAKRTTAAKKTTRPKSVIKVDNIFVRFPKALRNNGKGNEEGPIVGIEVMLATGKGIRGGKQIVYWTTDGKEGMTSYSSLQQLIEDRQLHINSLTLHRVHEAELKLLREAAKTKR